MRIFISAIYSLQFQAEESLLCQSSAQICFGAFEFTQVIKYVLGC